MQQELVVLVDNRGNPIGAAPKEESHNKNTPLHLGFSVYVFNKKGQFLITKRAKSKKTFPGVWSNSCCGHPAPGEKIENAVKRRLKDELGLTPKKVKLVLPDFRYKASMNGIVENEICPVFVALVDKEPKLNPNEVEDYKWVEWREFLKDIRKNKDKYSPWCVKQVQRLPNSPWGPAGAASFL